MKKCFKLLLIFSVFVLIICALESFSMAYDWSAEANSMLSKSTSYDNKGASKSAKNIVGAIITVTRTIATGIAIIMLIAVAIKYMTSAPGDRADIKKHAVVYVVGAVVLFATSGILTIIAKFASSI